MQDIFNKSQWLSSPTAYWTIQYEYRRNGVDMQYRFYWKVWLGSSGGWYNNGLQLQMFLNGSPIVVTVKGYTSGTTGWSYDGTTDWYTVANKTSGTTPFYAVLYDTSTSTTKVTSSSYSLAVSPSGATLTSAPNFTDEGNPTIYYTNPAGNNVSSLQACISWTGGADISYRDISKTGTSYTFILSDAERKKLREASKSSNSLKVTFYVTTKIGGAIFYSTVEKTLSIVNANPTFTAEQISYADTSERTTKITNNPLQIVQNNSNLVVTLGKATAKKEATISKYEITVNGVTKTATTDGTVDFGTINTSANSEIAVKVTDSRGNTTTAKKTVVILPYSAPVVNVKLERHNNYEDETYLTVDVSVASLDGKNTLTIGCQYAEEFGMNWTNLTLENKTTYTLSCDKNKNYEFNINVLDAFSGVTQQMRLPKGKFPLFIDTGKNAVGINDFPVEGEALRVSEGIANFMGGVEISNRPLADFIIERGTSGIWTYEKWDSGKAVCWGVKSCGTVEITTTWGSLFESASPYTENYPTNLFADVPQCFARTFADDGASLAEDFGKGTKTTTQNIYFVRPAQLTVSNAVISFLAIGRWK